MMEILQKMMDAAVKDHVAIVIDRIYKECAKIDIYVL